MIARLGALVSLVLALGLLVAPTAASAPEAEVGPTKTLNLSVPRGYADQTVTATVGLRTARGGPDAGREVRLQRYDGSAWRGVATLTTDAAGRASTPVRLARKAPNNRFRALHTTPARTLIARRDVLVEKRASTLTLAGQARVADGKPVTLRMRWVTGNGVPLASRIAVQRREGSRWVTAATVRADAEGRATHTIRPFGITRLRAVGAEQSWVRGATSDVVTVRSVPPGQRVTLPKGAPSPRVSLPGQPRAVGQGANASASRIGEGVWRSMVGRSWRSGCPVGRAGLRLVRTNYWDFDGYRRRGELVVNASIAGKTVNVMRALYDARIPIRHMYRVDRFGFSKRLRGADDYASMAADNTSAFNCRDVVGRPGRRSPHASGKSIDINPWENPYKASHGWTPNTWWVGKTHPRVAWRSRSHQVVRIFNANGFRWTYGTFDAHHFDGERAAELARRPLACDGGVCH